MDVPTTSAAPTLADSQKPKSRLARLIGWCLPNRVDGLIFLCSTMLLLALGEPILMQTVGSLGMRHSFHGIGAVFIAAAGCVCGVAALAALRRFNLHVGLILMAVCVAAFAAFTFATVSLRNIDRIGFYGKEPPLSLVMLSEGAFSFWLRVLAVGAVAFLVVFIVTWAATRLIERSVWFGNRVKFSRTNVLIFIAIVLLILGTIQNLFFPNGFLAKIEIQNSNLNEVYVEAAVSIVLGLVAVGAFVVLPTHLLTQQIKRRWKVLTLLAIFGLGLFLVVLQQAFYSMFGDSGRFLVQALLFEFFLLSTVILTARRPLARLNEADDRSVRRLTQKRFPTIWSLIPTGLVVLLMAIILFFDVATLAVTKGRDWEAAYLVKKIARESNNQMMIHSCWAGNGLICNFKNGVKPDILADVDMQIGGRRIVAISVAGLKPGVVTANLRGQLTGSVVLMESRVTSAQLQDLVGSRPFHVNLEDVEVVDPNGTVNVGTSDYSWISWRDGFGIESLFGAIAPAQDGHVHLSSEGTCDRNELDAIVELSQKISVTINHRIFNDMVSTKFQPKMSMQNIIVDEIELADFGNESTGFDGSDLNGWKYALGHDLFLSIGSVSDEGPFWDKGLFWDVAFAKNVNANPNYANWILKSSLSVESTFRDHAKWFHWKFGENENQEVTELFLPQAESVFDRLGVAEMAHFKSLETLSFDPLWLSRISPSKEARNRMANQMWGSVLFKNLTALPNLKRLDISRQVAVEDPSILARIPKIEHLQIGFAESSKTLADFSLCKQLQTLVYIGTPPIVTAQQLGTLANLKSVVIVDDGQLAVSGENAIKNLENSIPGVTVTVVPASEFLPQPPESFKKHVEERAGRIRMDIGIEIMP